MLCAAAVTTVAAAVLELVAAVLVTGSTQNARIKGTDTVPYALLCAFVQPVVIQRPASGRTRDRIAPSQG